MGLFFFTHLPRGNSEASTADRELARGIGLEVEIPTWVLWPTTLRCDEVVSLAGTEWDEHVQSIIRVTRSVLHRSAATGLWHETSEVALFVADITLPAAVCAKAIREHWGIENRSHYVRDGSFAEDASRIRCNPGIFARLRSFATNILRFNNVHNLSDARHRIGFGGLDAVLDLQLTR